MPWKTVLHLGREGGEGERVSECEGEHVGEVCVRVLAIKCEAIDPFQHYKLARVAISEVPFEVLAGIRVYRYLFMAIAVIHT